MHSERNPLRVFPVIVRSTQIHGRSLSIASRWLVRVVVPVRQFMVNLRRGTDINILCDSDGVCGDEGIFRI